MTITLGANAKAYRLSTGSRATWGALSGTTGFHEGAAPSNLDEVTNVVDVTIDTGDVSVQGTTRGNAPCQGYDYGLDDYTVNLVMRYDRADTDLLAILKARGSRTFIAMAFLDGDKATVGVLGYWGDWIVASDPKSEPLADGQSISLTLKPASASAVKPVERVKVTA